MRTIDDYKKFLLNTISDKEFVRVTSDNKSLLEKRIGVFFIVDPQLLFTFQTPNINIPIPSEGLYLYMYPNFFIKFLFML